MRATELLEGIKVYHGSKNGHGKFEIGHQGNNSHTFGEYNSTRYGVFFTNNPKFAAIYGDVDTYDLSLSKKDIINLDDNPNFLYYFVNDFMKDYENGDYFQDARHLQYTWQYFDGEVGAAFAQYVKEKGFKAATFEEENEDDNGKNQRSKTLVLYDLHRVRRNPDKNQPDLFLK